MAWAKSKQAEPEPEPASDYWVDQLLPEDLEWQSVVRQHPWFALSVAAGVGFLLGSRRGSQLMEDLADMAADGVTQGVNAYLGND